MRQPGNQETFQGTLQGSKVHIFHTVADGGISQPTPCDPPLRGNLYLQPSRSPVVPLQIYICDLNKKKMEIIH